MFSRTAAAVSVLVIGLAGSAGTASAQFFPNAPQLLPPVLRPMPPVAIEDDGAPAYDPPAGYGRQAPEPYGLSPPGVESNALPPPGSYRPAPGYEPVDPRYAPARPNYSAAPPQDDALRPPMSIGPGEQQGYQDQRGYPPQQGYQQGYQQPQRGYQQHPQQGYQQQPQQGYQGQQQPVYASLPPDDQPETGPRKELAPQFRRTLVDLPSREPAGTIVIDTPNTYLYLILGKGKAMRYGIGVGREGFTWSGAERVSRMAEWPDWHPPAEMIERQPYLPRFMAGGEGNPLGARALYLGQTLYRIHGTNQPSTIGTFVSSGCIRLTNEDVSDLYTRVQVGTRVVVLPGRPPATASAAPMGNDGAAPGPYNPLATRH